ncbi:MAG: type II toxin-antitoxin system VapC family toxin [Bacteroidales bacterium]|jgi:predicted nucleic acid-binding protein
MKQRIYIDTSVIGGYFDEEFSSESKWIFDQVKKRKIKIVYSQVTEEELRKAPEKVKELIKALHKDDVEFVKITDEAVELAEKYLADNVVGETSFADCLHIALATIHKVDILVSWNFKHIVNVSRIRGYNSVNLKKGYQTLEIRSPKEIIDYED